VVKLLFLFEAIPAIRYIFLKLPALKAGIFKKVAATIWARVFYFKTKFILKYDKIALYYFW
jgi:hypothetical protein